MNFNFLRIIIFLKKSPEKVVSWVLLGIFIGLTSYLVIGEPGRKASFLSEGMTSEGIREKPVTQTAVSMDFEGLLVKKPLTYYSDFICRNPFVRLPGVAGLVALRGPEGGKGRRVIRKPESKLICRGIVGTADGLMAFIDDGKKSYPGVKKGDMIGGWKIIKIDEEKVTLYNGEKNKKLVLPLGGGPRERERARKRAEERRMKRQGRRQGNSMGAPPGRFNQGLPPGLPPVGR
jgi:hypothetical protein